ncbi:hypothetical protein Tco_0336233 [Tanacetum coccineum]
MNREGARFNSLVLETRVMSGENDDDWMTRVEKLYKSVTGTEYKHRSAWLFFKDKHKWRNSDSTNARRNRRLVTDEEPELFGDDELPRPPDKQRIAKSQRSTKLSASSGSNPRMFQEMLQQQYDLDRREKMERIDREMAARVDLINSQMVAEDLIIVQVDTREMDLVDVAIINGQKARIWALYQGLTACKKGQVADINTKHTKLDGYCDTYLSSYLITAQIEKYVAITCH